MAQAGQELFRLIRGGRLEWRAEVPAADLGRIGAGTPAVVTLPPFEGAPSRWCGNPATVGRGGALPVPCPHPTKGHKAFGNRHLAQSAAGGINTETRTCAQSAL